MSYPSIHGPGAATYAQPSPESCADASPRPGPVERQLLASVARDARGLSFEVLYAEFPHDIGRDALRDAALDCLRLKWLTGTFACLRCTDAGRRFLQVDDAGGANACPARAAGADRQHAPPPGQRRAADSRPHLRVAISCDPRTALIEAKPEKPDPHLRVRKKLGRLACIDFGDPPLGGPGRRSATAVARRLVLGLKCLFLPSYRDARAVSRHMGELLGALTRPVDLLPVAAPVRGWPPLSRAHVHFIAADELALLAEARAVRVAGIPPEERYKPTPISLCIPPLTRHISRLGGADRKALLHGVDQELSRLMQYAGNALPAERPGMGDKDEEGDAASLRKMINPGDPLRYRMLLTMVKFLVEDAQQPLR